VYRALVIGFVLLCRSEGADVSAIIEMNGHSRESSQMSKRQRKESVKNLLTHYEPHRNHLVQQMKAVLVRHGNGKATASKADFTAVAEATYGVIHSSTEQQLRQDKVLRELKALSKPDLFRQSKVVGKKWWSQAGGKGPRTAAVLKANYKAALAKAAEKEAPTDDEPL